MAPTRTRPARGQHTASTRPARRHVGCPPTHTPSSLTFYTRHLPASHHISPHLIVASPCHCPWCRWCAYVQEYHAATEVLHASLAALRNSGLRHAFNTLCGLLSRPADPKLQALVYMVNAELARGLRTWAAQLDAYRAMRTALRRLSNDRLYRALNSWFAFLDARQRSLDQLSRKVSKAIAGPIFLAINKWRRVATNGKTLYRVCASIMLSRQRLAFNTMHFQCARTHEAKKRARAALRALSPEGRMLRKGLSSWMDAAHGLQRARAALVRLVQRDTTRAFMQWADAAGAAAEAQTRLAAAMYTLSPTGRALRRAFNQMSTQLEGWLRVKRAIARMSLISVVRAVNTWRRSAGNWREGRRAFAHLLHHGLSKGMATWHEYTRMILLKRRVAMALRGSGLIRGLNQWMAHAEASANSSRLLTGALHALRSSGLRRAFNVLADQLDAPPPAALKALSYMLHHELAKGFASWLASILATNTALGKLRRAGGHWMAMKLARCINKWEAYLHQRLMLQRAVSHLFASHTRLALSQWMGAAKAISETKVRMVAIARVFSIEGRAMRKSLNQWVANADGMRRMRRAAVCLTNMALVRAYRKLAAVAATAAHLQVVMFRMRNVALVRAIRTWRRAPHQPSAATQAAARLANQPLAKALEKWWAVHSNLACLRRAASHLANRALSAAWRSWEAFLDERELMASALSALLHASLIRALNTWVAWAEDVAETRAKISGVLAAMRSNLRAAFNSWHEHSVTDMDAAYRTLRHIAHRGLSLGWNSWRQMVVQMDRMRTALAHISGQGLVKAMGSWEEYVREQTLKRRALASLVHTASYAAVRQWRRVAALRGQQLTKLRATLAVFRGPHKRAMNTWKEFIADVATMRRAIAKLFYHQQARAWSTWRAQVAHVHAQRHRMRAALCALTSGMCAGFNSWHEYALETRFAKRALSALTSTSTRKVFNKWDEFTSQRTEMRAKKAAALRTLLSVSTRRAFNSWACQLVQLEPLRRAAGYMLHAAVARGMTTWLAYVDALEAVRRALAHVFHADTARALRTWVAYADERERMLAICYSMLHSSAKRALRRWARSATDREEKLRVMRGTLEVLAGGHRTKKAINSWRHLLDERRRALYALSAFTHGASRQAWNRWASLVRRSHTEHTLMRAVLMFDERKALNTWRANAIDDSFARTARLHWKNCIRGHSYRRWRLQAARGRVLRHAVRFFLNLAVSKAWRSWLDAHDQMLLLRRAFVGFANAECVRSINTWVAYVEAVDERRRKALSGVAAFLNIEVRRVWNSWVGAITNLGPLHRAIAHWGNAPMSRALFHLKQHAANTHLLRQRLFRIANMRLGKGFNTWGSNVQRRRRAGRFGAAFIHRHARRGFNSWLAHWRGKKRLRAIMQSWRGGVRRGFNKWKENTRRRSPELLGAPVGLRCVRSMTWREVCTWLNRIGIPVSRSPPTLLMALKSGKPYVELVRRLAPTFHVRHKMDKLVNTLSLFQTIQSFFETDTVVRTLGYQRLAVRSLADDTPGQGGAIEHLELLASFREVMEEAYEIEVARRGVVYSPD